MEYNKTGISVLLTTKKEFNKRLAIANNQKKGRKLKKQIKILMEMLENREVFEINLASKE